jgi:hypothetical protein
VITLLENLSRERQRAAQNHLKENIRILDILMILHETNKRDQTKNGSKSCSSNHGTYKEKNIK